MCELPSTTGGMSTTASVPTVHWHTGRPMSSDASWAMEMWKAKNASHISTALTTAARYTRPQHQTEKLQLWLDEKTGAGQFLFKLDDDPAAQRELPVLAEEPLQINFRAIRSILSADSESSIIDEVISLYKVLDLAGEGGEQPDLQDLIANLREARSEWDWKEKIDPTNISIAPAIGQLTEPGIYNRAVLIPMENSPYTRGLES